MKRRDFLKAAALTTVFSPLAADAGLNIKAERRKKAHVLYEFSDGRIPNIFSAENTASPIHPASLTKLITLAVAFDQIKENPSLANKEIYITDDARIRSGAHRTYLSHMTLGDAIRYTAVRSYNDAAIAIAEGISGAELRFIDDFIKPKAKMLGMSTSEFWNVNGMPGHYYNEEIENYPYNATTVEDLMKLTNHILTEHPEKLREVFSLPCVSLHGREEPNTNPLLEGSIASGDHIQPYPGVDGLKTGWTLDSGSNLIATAQRYGRRLIVISVGNDNALERTQNVTALLDQGFEIIKHEVELERQRQEDRAWENDPNNPANIF